MVRQLHVPEAGELVHEKGVLFDDGVENILGREARGAVSRGRGTEGKWRVVLQRTQLSRPSSTCVCSKHRLAHTAGHFPHL